MATLFSFWNKNFDFLIVYQIIKPVPCKRCLICILTNKYVQERLKNWTPFCIKAIQLAILVHTVSSKFLHTLQQKCSDVVQLENRNFLQYSWWKKGNSLSIHEPPMVLKQQGVLFHLFRFTFFQIYVWIMKESNLYQPIMKGGTLLTKFWEYYLLKEWRNATPRNIDS